MANGGLVRLIGLAGVAGVTLCASLAQAAETRQYVASKVFFAEANKPDGSDCDRPADGNVEIFKRALQELSLPPEQVEKLSKAFPNRGGVDIINRGVIDGKRVNVYLYPWSSPDPKHPIVKGTDGVGFNLDGKDKPGDLVDLITGERGIDNQVFRAIGCTGQQSAPLGKPSNWQDYVWGSIKGTQPAWLFEITGIDNIQNDDDVMVSVAYAQSPVLQDGQGAAQAGATYVKVNSTQTAGNVVRGRIKNGLLTTDKFEFFMPGEARVQPDYRLRDARMRFHFNADGVLVNSFFGGYIHFPSLWSGMSMPGSAIELTSSQDILGYYHNYRKLADAYPNESGQNEYISVAYQVDLVPTLILPPTTTVAQKGGKQ